jgi:NhaP-type Na+/H+ or K+/H+ antiporter
MNNLVEINRYLEHYPSLLIVLTTMVILLTGLTGQILSRKTSIPAIIYFMIFGTILGKYGLHVINPDVYGKTGLRAIIAISVAIIVFEGGLLINLKHLKHNLVSIIGLITANVFVTVFCMTFITWALLDLDFRIALLYSSLVSVTGPTVIAPILRRIHLKQKLKTILETEAVLVDAIGVLTVVGVFNYITADYNVDFIEIFNDIFASLFIGIISGFLSAYTAKLIVRKFSPLNGEIIRLLVLSLAVTAYTLGELLSHESGITAVAVAGMIIGNSDFPYKRSIIEFKGDLTMLSITLVFLLLAADIDLGLLVNLGIKGIICVLILMLLVRPLGVFISTFFEKINWKERLFIASLGPRGIVAASAATFFSVELEAFGIEGSEFIRSMVFLTILITVIIEGGGAGYMAKILDLAPMSILIIGGGFIGKELAYKMQESGNSIIIIENNERKVDSLLKEGLYVINADASNENIYKSEVNTKNIKGIITTSEDDWLNLRVCQIFKKLKPEIEAVSIINDLKSRDVFESFGIKTINPSEAIVSVLSNSLTENKL